IRLWRTSDGALVKTLTGHGRNVWHVDFSPDGRLLASGSFDKTAKIWRVDSGALVRTLIGHKEAVVCVAFHPSGQWLASSGDDSSVKIWRVADGVLQKTLTGGSDHIYTVAFSRDGLWLASGGRERGNFGTLWKQISGNRFRRSNDPTVRLWRVRDGALLQALAEHPDGVRSLAFS